MQLVILDRDGVIIEDSPDYVKCRVQAEDLSMSYCGDMGLPGVACWQR